ncbi:MAG: glycosyltransferase family 2 protein [Gemmatimonadaceae bacterium]|nr:glycosyltransferase family 2 protein [Gemmatimonadaceae bacterium]
MTLAFPPRGERRQHVSAVFLTRNEEAFIARALRSVRGVVDEIVVVDSCSTDATVAIAESFGARVIVEPWRGWIAQRALGIRAARHPWVFVMEADEIVTPELAAAIHDVLATAMNARDGYSVDRRDDFLGALLPRMKRPSKRRRFVRLFHRDYSRYDPQRIVHDEVRFSGRAIPLRGVLLHWRGFTIAQQVARYTEYAPLEAEMLLASRRRIPVAALIVRPLLRFGWCYVACGGLRLGARGFVHALMVAVAEFLRHATAWEQQRAPALPHPPSTVLSRFGMRGDDDVLSPSEEPATSGTTEVPRGDESAEALATVADEARHNHPPSPSHRRR